MCTCILLESGDVVIDHTDGEAEARTHKEKEVDIHKIPSHCVIVASRCDWFRRALLSGMRESIDKYVDETALVFIVFLSDVGKCSYVKSTEVFNRSKEFPNA